MNKKLKLKLTEDEIIEKLKDIVKETGEFPKYAELQKWALLVPIKEIGKGLDYYRDKLEIKRIRSYWNENTITIELEDMMQEIGHFPTSTELLNKRGNLLNAINKNNGYSYYKDKFGFKVKVEKWDEDRVVSELKIIIDFLGKFPTNSDLVSIGRIDLIGAIAKENKGFFYYKDKLGFEQTRKQAGYWENYENIEYELKILIEKLGYFPTTKDFCDLRLSSLHSAIINMGKTLNYYRTKFGFEVLQKDNGYWDSWENLENEIKPFIKNGKFPSGSLLNKNLGSIQKGIKKFGGIAKVAEKMGYKSSYFHTATDGHYLRSFNEYLFDEFLFSRGISHEVDGVITEGYKFRYDFKIGDYFIEIWGFDSNRNNERSLSYKLKREKKEELYRKYELKLISIEFDVFDKSSKEIEKYFEDLMGGLGFDISVKMKKFDIEKVTNNFTIWTEDKVIDELQKVIKLIGKFPTSKELYVIGSNLRSPIAKFGGYPHFAEKMGFGPRPSKYWTEEKIIDELKLLAIDGEMPTLNYLNIFNYKLSRAVSNHGGFKYFADKLGYNYKPNSKGSKKYWTEDRTIKELIPIVIELGELPSEPKLIKINSKLSYAVSSNSGYPYFRQKLAFLTV